MSATINTSAGTQPLDPYKSKNTQDPPLQQKIEDLVNFIKEVKYGMLTTKLSTENDLLSSRCMALAGQVSKPYGILPCQLPDNSLTYKQEHSGIDLLFHTNLFSSKTLDLSIHPTETNMSFLDPVSGSWASISGTAHIVSDPETVQKWYTPSLKAWLGDLGDGVHDGGPNDPRIGIIRLEAKLVTYAVARKGMVERAYESVKGAATGDVPEINSLRELREPELNECKLGLLSRLYLTLLTGW